MRAFATGSLLVLALSAAGCGGEFTPLGNEPGRGGNGAAAGMAGTSGSAGTASAGAPGTGGNGGSANSGGTGGGTSCQSSADCKSTALPAMKDCPDGSTVTDSYACVSGQCEWVFPACPASQCTTDSDCGKSMSTCVTCSDGSQNCPWTHCESGQCASGWTGCGQPAPCAGKACGDACSTCTGTDPCPAIAMFCDQNLTCQVNQPVCGATTCTTSADCMTTAEAAGKACPDGSTVTASYDCVSGQCEWVFPACPVSQCTTDSDCPRSLAPCQLCADGSSACPWARCDNGQCSAGIDTCPVSPDPCAGKSCGDACTTCTGSGPCNAMAMYCDQNLTCQVNEPVCGATTCTTNSDCPSTTCGTCPNGSTTSCVPEACIGGQCTAACSGTSPCGTCAAGTTCVYQVGGPGGPEGFRCSTQNPCGAAGRCACIVGEGTCMDPPDSTGYCACDNGLE